MSPSHTVYSLPSTLILPASLTADSEPSVTKSSYLITSARMKPFSKSVCIMPAACGAFVPLRKVHARTSSAPAVKYVWRSSSAYAARMRRFTPLSSRPIDSRNSRRSS